MADIQGIVKALDANGRVIDIEEVPDEISERGTYTCMLCETGLIARKGTQRMHHFAHRSAQSCDPWASGMTEWHLTGQRLLEVRGASLEVPFRETDAEGHRHRLDVLVTDRGGYRLGIELQHSPMGIDMFDVRNEFYLGELDELIWVFDVRGREIELGGPYRPDNGLPSVPSMAIDRYGTWKRQPRWFCPDCLSQWYRRGVTVFLYVDGADDWTGGRLVEVIAPAVSVSGAYGDRHWIGRECRASDWLADISRGGSFVARNRMFRLTYAYHDGTSEMSPARYGMPLPSPVNRPEAPAGKADRTPRPPSRMPSRDLILRQRLENRVLSVRVIGRGCSVSVPYGSTRSQVLACLREELIRQGRVQVLGDIDPTEVPDAIMADVSLHPRRRGRTERRKRREDIVASRRPAPESTAKPRPKGWGRDASRHEVRFVDDDGNDLGFVKVDDGSDLRDAAISMFKSLKMFGTVKDYEWPTAFPGQVTGDMRITLPRKRR